MGNPFGRNTVLPLTNKSGGSVIAGDFVYIDTANNDSFTTGTTGAYTKGIGVAQQSIASNAVGLVLVNGYASLVNVNASVTRGNFLKSHTVVKQGTDAGASRVAGTCGMFLTGGTTPDAIIWQPDLGAGSGELVASSAIWTTAGKVAVATGSGTATEQWPPAHEFDYVAITGNVTVSATSEATATTIVTGSAVTYDGSTVVNIEFYAPAAAPAASSGDTLNLWLYDGSSSIGVIAQVTPPASATLRVPVHTSRRLTPSNASHTYSIRGSVGTSSGTITAGAGGTGVGVPAFIRITKV